MMRCTCEFCTAEADGNKLYCKLCEHNCPQTPSLQGQLTPFEYSMADVFFSMARFKVHYVWQGLLDLDCDELETFLPLAVHHKLNVSLATMRDAIELDEQFSRLAKDIRDATSPVPVRKLP